jgi:hypothetical protein
MLDFLMVRKKGGRHHAPEGRFVNKGRQEMKKGRLQNYC